MDRLTALCVGATDDTNSLCTSIALRQSTDARTFPLAIASLSFCGKAEDTLKTGKFGQLCTKGKE
jgi:hypothetical protein